MEFSPQILLSIALFSVASSISPGPNNMMLLASGVNFGARKTLPHLFGIVIGHNLMLILVAIGIAQIFDAFPMIYQIMKIAGFSYLIYLAWRVATSEAPNATENKKTQPLGFFGAALFQWVNPKAWLVSVTFTTNYIAPTTPITYTILACLLYSVIVIPMGGSWLMLGVHLEHYLKNPKTRLIFNWLMAFLLVASMIPVLLT